MGLPVREPDKEPLHARSVTEVNAREISGASIRTEVIDQAAQHVERREHIEGSAMTVTWRAEADEPDLDPAILKALTAKPIPPPFR
ncbi:hypothetical protein GS921_25020 [Rhodococcus hoagii]|nr:hypothetical protein [Prescottella equi]